MSEPMDISNNKDEEVFKMSISESSSDEDDDIISELVKISVSLENLMERIIDRRMIKYNDIS